MYAIWEPYVFTVTFYNFDGSVISQKQYGYQDWIETPEDPQKPSDDKSSYVFAGWDKKVSDVAVRDEEYHATYKSEPLPPQEKSKINWKIAVGIAAGAVVAAAAVVIAVIAVKKKKKAAVTE